jgi:hypothetical protein
MLVFADLAQLVEQHIRNVKVASSIPAIGTISPWKLFTVEQNSPPPFRAAGFFVCGRRFRPN